jgi:hypothetical protein
MSSDPDVSADRLTTLKPSKLPITQVTQTLNLKYQTLFPTVLSVLKSRGIPVESVDSSVGRIVTEPLDMEESLCGSHGAERVPLDCTTRYTFQLKPLTEIASSMKIDYTQNCEAYDLTTLACPESKAERLLVDIVNQLKGAAGVVDQSKN